jgi:hypothetical protein
MVNDKGLSLNDFIIGLRAKERESKVEGRFFAMSWNLRLYFVVTEYLRLLGSLPRDNNERQPQMRSKRKSSMPQTVIGVLPSTSTTRNGITTRGTNPLPQTSPSWGNSTGCPTSSRGPICSFSTASFTLPREWTSWSGMEKRS